jgi:hypothetical protein
LNLSTVLRGMQSLLGRLYDVEVQHDVYDYLVTDRGTLRNITRDNDTRALDEELLLAETDDGAGVALYLDPALLQRLDDANPLGELTEGNLADYCTALEGVSHFVYTTWCLGRDAPVSLLELETQAEVDKYGRHVPGSGAPAAVRSREFRCAPGTRTIPPLPHRAPLCGSILPAPGATLRTARRGAHRGLGAGTAKILPLGVDRQAGACARVTSSALGS